MPISKIIYTLSCLLILTACRELDLSQDPFLTSTRESIIHHSVLQQYTNPSIAKTPPKFKSKTTDEPFAEFRFPEGAISDLFKDAVLTKITTEEPSYIKILDDIQLSPYHQTITFSGTFTIPPHLVGFLDHKLEPGLLESIHRFKLTFKPSVRVLPDNNYLNLQFTSFTINDLELVQLFPLLSQFVLTILSNSQLSNIIQDKEHKFNKRLADFHISVRIHEFTKQKHIQFFPANKTIRLAIQPDKVFDLNSYKKTPRLKEVIESLRLWTITPMRFLNSNVNVFYIAIGIGKPSSKWINRFNKRLKEDAQKIVSEQQDELKEYSNIPLIEKDLRQQLEKTLDTFGLKKLFAQERAEKYIFLEHIKKQIQNTLTINNPSFLLNPRNTFEKLNNSLVIQIRLFIEDLANRRYARMSMFTDGTSRNTKWPVWVQQIGQRSLNGLARQLRDVQVNNKYIFNRLNIKIMPKLPGIMVSGNINNDINDILPNYLKKTDGSPFTIYQSYSGQGIPFTALLSFHFLPNSWLRMQLIEGTLFSGDTTIRFTPYQETGHFILRLIQLAVTKAIINITINLPTAAETVVESLRKEENIKEVKQKLRKTVREIYLPINKIPTRSFRDSVTAIGQLLERNFQTSSLYDDPEQNVVLKRNLEKMVKYRDGAIYIRLDPNVTSKDLIPRSSNIQIWNVEPTYAPSLGQSFLEIAVGTGYRNKQYVQLLSSRKRKIDSITGNSSPHSKTKKKSSTVGFRTFIGFDNLNQLINGYLREIKTKINREIDLEMKKNQVQEHVRVNSLAVKIRPDLSIELYIYLSLIEKTERSIWNPFSWGKDRIYKTTDTIFIKINLYIKQVPISRLLTKGKIDLRSKEVLFNDYAFAIDLSRSVIETGKYFLLRRILKILDIATLGLFGFLDIDKIMKQIAFEKLKPLIDNNAMEGNTILWDAHINRYAKLLLKGDNLIVVPNPKFLSRYLEVVPIPSSKNNNIVIYPMQNMLQLDYASRPTLVQSDQERLFRIYDTIQKLFEPLTSGRMSANTFLRSTNLKVLFENVDANHPSLFQQLLDINNEYPELNKKYHTECGLEIMLFAASVYAFHGHIQYFVSQLDQDDLTNEETEFVGKLVDHSTSLRANILWPFMTIYNKRHLTKNNNIITRGPTDWTYLFYKEALFAHMLYMEIVNSY